MSFADVKILHSKKDLNTVTNLHFHLSQKTDLVLFKTPHIYMEQCQFKLQNTLIFMAWLYIKKQLAQKVGSLMVCLCSGRNFTSTSEASGIGCTIFFASSVASPNANCYYSSTVTCSCSFHNLNVLQT